MNHAIIDNALLATSFLLALLITRFTQNRKAGFVKSFFLLCAPLLIFLNMWAHTIAVSIVNIKRYQAGSFQYSFTFYGLLLFGVVFIIVSGLNIHQVRIIIKGDISQKSTIHWLNLITATLFLPMMFINPIALLPVLASIVSSGVLRSIKPPIETLVYARKSKSQSIIKQN